jgi:hypothetical protein
MVFRSTDEITPISRCLRRESPTWHGIRRERLGVSQTPQSGLSFGGGNGRANGFFIDGVENYANSGGVRFAMSQEAVQEFQINRNSFSVEYGWTSGGTVNIVTRSGPNDVHGNFFGFVRDRAIQARNYFSPGNDAFRRMQGGATLGGPIKRNKTFVFLGFERLRRDETAIATILHDGSVLNTLTKSQQLLMDFFSSSGNVLLSVVASQARRLLTPGTNPAVEKLFRDTSGPFPFEEKQSRRLAKGVERRRIVLAIAKLGRRRLVNPRLRDRYFLPSGGRNAGDFNSSIEKTVRARADLRRQRGRVVQSIHRLARLALFDVRLRHNEEIIGPEAGCDRLGNGGAGALVLVEGRNGAVEIATVERVLAPRDFNSLYS